MKRWNVAALRDALRRGVQGLATDPGRPLPFCAADNAVLKVEPAEGDSNIPRRTIRRCRVGVASLKRNKPAHAPETAGRPAAPAVAAPVASRVGALASDPPPPDFRPSQAGWRVMIISWRTSPWPADHPPGRPGPERPHRPHQPHSCRPHRPGAGDVSARNAASTSGVARVGETPTTRIPEFAHTDSLRHAAFTCLCVRDDGAADAGIPDATGTTCSRSDEDGGASSNARVPFPDHRDRQETLGGCPVACPMGPRRAQRDPQVEAGIPALSVTKPPPVAGERARVLRYRAQPYRLRSRKASGSCLETHGAYRPSAGLHSCNCAYDIPKSTTSRSEPVDSR